MRAQSRLTAVTIFGIVALAACASTSDPTPPASTCPNDLPAACPTTVPSYKNDVAPLVSRRCLDCHVGGSQAAKFDFPTYDGVYAQRSAILNQVYACNMPPSEATQPTTAERETLLAWLVCKAPNN